jgi:hypothetical protein
MMTPEEINQDIHAMDEELWHYEVRYGLRTPYFYELYRAGRLRDEDPIEARDYSDWAACYEIKQDREQRYDTLIREALEQANIQLPLSLTSLRLDTTSSSV